MSGLHVLVDFENVQPTFDEVAKLAPGVAEVWLFHGPHQVKLAHQFKAAHDGVTAVPISKTGKNALDFHLSFYLGYVAAKHPTGRCWAVTLSHSPCRSWSVSWRRQASSRSPAIRSTMSGDWRPAHRSFLPP